LLRFVTPLSAKPCDIDITKQWKHFSPYSKEFVVQHPCDPEVKCVSVAACWAGSLIHDKHKLEPDADVFSGAKGLSRKFKPPYAYWIGHGRVTGFVSLARRMIYIPAYTLFVCRVLDSCKEVHDEVRHAFHDNRALYDDESGTVDGLRPVSAAVVLAQVLNSFILTYNSHLPFVMDQGKKRETRGSGSRSGR